MVHIKDYKLSNLYLVSMAYTSYVDNMKTKFLEKKSKEMLLQ